ncbi:hypothetical protein ACVDG8_008095 [Mesorhizobium sp. ORM8.1]
MLRKSVDRHHQLISQIFAAVGGDIKEPAMRASIVVSLVLSSLGLAACSASDATQAEQLDKRAGSLAATALMALNGWLDSSLPSRYTGDTLDAMTRQISQVGEQLGKKSGAGVAGGRAGRISNVLVQARAGLDDDDRVAVEKTRDELASAIRDLASSAPAVAQ